MKGLYAYFAYGSNLLSERLFQRCPTAVPYAPAILPNYRLTERLYADVDYAPGKQVHGFVYLLRAHDVARLDRYEGYPRISPVTPMPEVRRAKFLVVFFCL